VSVPEMRLLPSLRSRGSGVHPAVSLYQSNSSVAAKLARNAISYVVGRNNRAYHRNECVSHMKRILKWLWLLLLPVMAMAQTATTDSGMNELLKKAWTAYAYDIKPSKLACIYGYPVVSGDSLKRPFHYFRVDSMTLIQNCDANDPGILGALFFMKASTVELFNEDRGIRAACEILDTKGEKVRVIGFVHGIGPKADSLGHWYRAAEVWACYR